MTYLRHEFHEFKSTDPSLFLAYARRLMRSRQVNNIAKQKTTLPSLAQPLKLLLPPVLTHSSQPAQLCKAGEAASAQAIHSHSPLRGFETAVWYFWFYKASLKDSKLPFGTIGSTRPNLLCFVRPLKPLGPGQSSSTVIHLLKVSKLPFGAFGFTRPNVPSLVTRLRQAVPKPFTAIHLLGLCR